MNLLVYPHDFAIGGSQINAIDLAAELTKLGHAVWVYGVAGPLVDYVEQRGLPYLPAASPAYRPAPQRITELYHLARELQLDAIHAYEWPPCLDAYYGAHLMADVALLCTVLSMEVSPLVPPSVPLIMGTAALRREAGATHRAPVHLMEPPIDVVSDHPELDGAAFRRQHGIADDEVLIVTVSRLATDLKLDALIRALDAVAELSETRRVRLVAVGDGDAGAELRRRAGEHNARLGRTVISLPGASMDPRPAYAAADIVLGMGSSALRAMAIGKPLIVQGAGSFSLPLTPDTLPVFLDQGFYGTADVVEDVSQLVGQLAAIIDDPRRRSELGRFGRQVVVDRFALGHLAFGLEDILADMVGHRRSWRAGLAELPRVSARALRNELRLHLPHHRRRRTRRLSDDFSRAHRST